LRWPDRIAIDTPNGSITYNELARKVKALAGGLIALDPQLQSRVAICAGNSADHIIALLAILACGKSWVPLVPVMFTAQTHTAVVFTAITSNDGIVLT